MKNENELVAKFTEFDNSSNWVSGEFGEYKFESKLFNVGSIFGIKKGRVSKLHVTLLNKDVVAYDRGWVLKPTKEHKTAYNAIMHLLENSPKRNFD